jgi:hypothetical protein
VNCNQQLCIELLSVIKFHRETEPTLIRYNIYVFSQNNNIVSIGQKLMCSIQFQSFLVLLGPPDVICLTKFEMQW